MDVVVETDDQDRQKDSFQCIEFQGVGQHAFEYFQTVAKEDASGQTAEAGRLSRASFSKIILPAMSSARTDP